MSSLNGSLLFYQIQMSSFWGCLLILHLQPIAPIFPGLEEDHSCLLKGSTRNCCKQEICGPSEYGDTPETWLQRIYLPSESRFFQLTIKRNNDNNKNLPLPTGCHQISKAKWHFSVFTIYSAKSPLIYFSENCHFPKEVILLCSIKNYKNGNKTPNLPRETKCSGKP